MKKIIPCQNFIAGWEFKEKVRLLGKQMIETMDNERKGWVGNGVQGHHDFYRFALLELQL